MFFQICAEGTSQADMFTCQFGAAREPELSRKARRSWLEKMGSCEKCVK